MASQNIWTIYDPGYFETLEHKLLYHITNKDSGELREHFPAEVASKLVKITVTVEEVDGRKSS